MSRLRTRIAVKRWGPALLVPYLVLLALSHYLIREKARTDPRERESASEVVTVGGKRLAYLEWGGGDPAQPPLILLHGSPSRGAMDWENLGPQLAGDGRRVIAIDRWGYGNSEPIVSDYSFAADQRAVLGLMKQLGIARAHVAGWSYGGGGAILAAEAYPAQILSLSLLGSIGIQEGEGSGSYVVEHGKYAALHVLANWVPEAVPHFGLAGKRSARRAFARDFLDCDQRPLRSHLLSLRTPTLIVHGKHDPLVPAWVAQEHHQLVPNSRLVILDGSHFFPLGVGSEDSVRIAVDEMRTFLAAVDAGSAPERFGLRNESSRRDLRALWDGGPALRGYKPWWVLVLAGLTIGLVVPRTGAVLFGLAGGLLVVDLTTAMAGLLLGSMLRRAESRTRFHRALGTVPWCLLGAIPGGLLLRFF